MNVNVIYQYPLETIIAKFPELANKIFIREGYEIYVDKLKIDNFSSSVDSLFVYKDFGSTDSFEDLGLIGTIGVNEIEDKILIIDYPGQTLKILEDTNLIDPKDYIFTPLEVTLSGKLKINLKIGDKKYPFLFDTGAGVVPATTIDAELYNLITESGIEKQDTISASSWGEEVSLIGNYIQTGIEMENFPINTQNKRFYYTNSTKHKLFYNELATYGSIGNEFFINNVIVLDLKRNLFGIKKR